MFVLLFLVLAGLGGCTGAQDSLTPFPTFTPISGFQILGGPTRAPTVTLTPTPGQTAAPTLALPATQAATTTPTDVPETPAPEEAPLITLVFTGQIVPARCVQAETDAVGSADYIYEAVRDLISTADISIGALNAYITDAAPLMGFVETFILTGSPIQADAMAAAGFDVMSVATNHIKNCSTINCGDQAFLDTLENLKRVGILPVGAGLNAAEAIMPVYVEKHGIVFGFVSLGQIEPLAFAGPETPGIAQLTADSLRAAIETARAQADVVIALPHWGPEYTRLPNASQRALAQVAVEAGADLVIGNHTHYIQAFISLQGIPVFFGLGNFVFDQTQEPERQQSLIVRLTYRGTEIISTEIFPVVNDRTGRVRIAAQNEAVEILTTIQQVNQDVQEDYP